MIFSVFGATLGFLLLAPPLFILSLFPPAELPPEIKRTAFSDFAATQIIGRFLCLLVLMFSYRSFQNLHIIFFTDVMIISIFFEYYLWIRYLLNGRYYAFLLESIFYLPLPILSLPLLAYLSIIIWTKNWWLCPPVLLLAAADIFICVKYRGYRSVIVYRKEEEE